MNNRKEDFDRYYDNFKDIIESNRKEEYNRCRKIKIKLILEISVLTVAILVFLYYAHINNMIKYYEIVALILSLALITGLIILNIRLLNKEKRFSCYILNAVIYELILDFLSNGNYYYKLNSQISEDDFNKMNLFNMQYLKFNGNNLTAAGYENKKLVMCDVWLYDLVERIKTDSYYSKRDNITYITNYHYHDRVDIFKGLYYETTINRDNDDYIYMIPNNFNDKFIQKNIYHYISYDGEKIELENLEFSEKYSVFSFDEIKSRYILSLTLMEKINRLDKLLNYKKYFVFKPDGRVGIFIDGLQLDNLFNQVFDLNSEVTKEYINKLFIKIHKLFDITQVLEDFNPFE